MRCERKGWGAVVALVGILAVGTARAQSGDATLKGVVRDALKNPIAGATVSATNAATKAVQTATTAEDGSYSLVLPAGSYSVQASAPRFWGPTHTADLTAGQERALDFSLQPMMTEVVTVTATKRETDPIDVPFSLEAHSGEDLRNRGADDIEDVAANVASFSVQNLGPGQSQVAMRGVSSGQIARDQPGVKEQVGIYLDESPVSMSLFTPDLDLVDVERVEVLRGPQGTLFGAGSETGTVRYITTAPVLNATEGFIEFGGGGLEGGSDTGNVKGAVNVPLGEKAAARLVGYYTKLPGFVDATQPDLSVDDNVNDGARKGGRLAVAFTPTEKLTITPRVVFQRAESDGWNLQDEYNILANPFTTTRPTVRFDDRNEFTQLDEEFTDDFTLGDLNIKYDFGAVTLTSISSYIDREIRIVRDTTALSASFTGGTAGFPEPIYTLNSPLYDNTDSSIWTQELRLSGENERVQWVGGVFYMNSERQYGQDVVIEGFTNATGIPTQGAEAPLDTIYFSRFDYDLDQYAVFGEATTRFGEKFSLTTGLRYYNYDENKAQFIDGNTNFSGNPNFPNDVLSIPGQVEADGFAPRVIGTWKFSEDAVLNAQVSKGFRLGGINDPLNVPLCTPQDLLTYSGFDEWKDESAWNYEVGYKSRIKGNAWLNIALFYMDIENLQTNITAGSCSSRLVLNAPEARSRGIELEYVATIGRNFELSFSGSYNDAELTSTLTLDDGLGNLTTVSGIEAGRRLPSVPEVQAAVSATYRWEVRGGSQMYVSGTWQYIGSRFTQVGDQDLGTVDLTAPPLFNTIGGPLTQTTFTFDPELPAYDILNLRAGWRQEVWDIALYVNNALDELALLALDRERGTLARVGYLTNQPRTVGIATRFNF